MKDLSSFNNSLKKNKLLISFISISLVAMSVAAYYVQKPKDITTNYAALIGDANGDGTVNILDFQILSNTFGKTSGEQGYDGRADFNGDNAIDILDFQILSNNFGMVAPTITPTPNSVTATPTGSICLNSNPTTWVSKLFSTQTGRFTALFDAAPSANLIDSPMGLSQSAPSAFTGLANIVRFNSSGFIDARNGSLYSAQTQVSYSGSVNYHFRLLVDIPNHKYDIYVTPPGSAEKTIGLGYAFRSEQATVTSLAYFGANTISGNTTICNFQVSSSTTSVTPTSRLTVTPTPASPVTISVTSPTAGSIHSGLFTLAATATTTSGGSINQVDFRIDQTNLGADGTSPFSIVLDTTRYTNGSHYISATAYDTRGNGADSRFVQFYIQNGVTLTPTPSGPTPTFPPISSNTGVWLSQQQIMALPTTGTAWNNVVNWANKPIGTPSINNQDSDSDQVALAQAFTCARINQHCSEVGAALNTLASTTPSGDRALAWGRNISSWVIAADTVYNSGNPSGINISNFKSWANRAIRTNSSEGETIIQCHEHRPNNWSTMCGGSRIAADLIDGDTADLNRAWDEYRGYVGDRSSGYLFANTVVTTNWRCPGDSDRTAINPRGCVKFGHNFDGVLPAEMLRQGEYSSWPPNLGTVYPFNGLAGIMLQAELLARHGYPSFTVADSAMLRAYGWLIDVAGFSGTSRTDWMPYIVNKRYAKSYPTIEPPLPGQNIGFVDWTHAR